MFGLENNQTQLDSGCECQCLSSQLLLLCCDGKIKSPEGLTLTLMLLSHITTASHNQEKKANAILKSLAHHFINATGGPQTAHTWTLDTSDCLFWEWAWCFSYKGSNIVISTVITFIIFTLVIIIVNFWKDYWIIKCWSKNTWCFCRKSRFYQVQHN